ncbi:MAG: DMT family transporter [Caldilineales bacterium]|nr:DMT family transporter [Caldilineales bacterium]
MPSLHRHRKLVADLGLLFVAFIWGLTFVMVQDAVQAYPVFAFLNVRFLFALIGLLPIVIWRRRIIRQSLQHTNLRRHLAAGGIIGVFLFAGYSFQTAGLLFTTPAKAGFITGLSVVIVPLLGVLLLRERPGLGVILGIGLATIGLALLSLSGLQSGAGVNPGDLLVLACAISFAAHIFSVGRFAPHLDVILLTVVQIATVMVLAGVASLLFEQPDTWPPRGQPLFAALFTGLLATALAFGLQTAAQRFTTATHTALIFATEPVFAALASFVLIGEVLGAPQLLGCILILAGMLAAELGADTKWSAKQGRVEG